MSELKEIREKILVNIKGVVEQNKEKVEDAYQRVMKLEHIARREGLLALEYEAEFIPKDTLLCNEIIEMIELIVDGTEPQIIEELMTIKFFAVHDYTEIEALLYFLYARSMLMIQSAVSPRLIEKFFNAVIPRELITFDKEHILWEEEKKHKIKEWISVLTLEEKELLCDISVKLQELSAEEWKYVIMNSSRAVTELELIELNKELEDIISRLRKKEERGILDDILKCSDKEIQLLLRNIDNVTLAIALKGVKEEVAECFFRNLSLRLKYIVQEDMEYMGPVRMSDVEDAQRKIVQTAKNILGWTEMEG